MGKGLKSLRMPVLSYKSKIQRQAVACHSKRQRQHGVDSHLMLDVLMSCRYENGLVVISHITHYITYVKRISHVRHQTQKKGTGNVVSCLEHQE